MRNQIYQQRIAEVCADKKRHTLALELEEQKFRNANRLEVFKAINSLSIFGFKFLMVINGGAAAAVASLAARNVEVSNGDGLLTINLQVAVACYVLGLVVSSVSLVLGWVSQIILFQRWSGASNKESTPSGGSRRLVAIISLGFSSVALFLVGSLEAIGFVTPARVLMQYIFC